jgi:GntR family transcriptional regulator/MocR family aminotransferase
MSNVYRARPGVLLQTLVRDFSSCFDLVPSNSGLHVSVVAHTAASRQIDASVRQAAEAGVRVQSLSQFAVDRESPAGFALGYGAVATADVAKGLRRLREFF